MKTPSRQELLDGALRAARTDAPSRIEVERLKRAWVTSAALAGSSSVLSSQAAASVAASTTSGAASGAANASVSTLGSTASANVASLGVAGTVSKVLVITTLGLGTVGGGSLAYVATRETPTTSGESVSAPPSIAPSPASPGRQAPSRAIGSPPDAMENPQHLSTKAARVGGSPQRVEPSKTASVVALTAPSTPRPSAHDTSPSDSALSGPVVAEMKAKRADALREAELIEAARRLVGFNPGETLVLLREHADAFPQGILGVERRVLTIEALMNLGRHAEAKQALEAFRRDYPSSVHMRRLETKTQQLQP
jgi:hypothetical protein